MGRSLFVDKVDGFSVNNSFGLSSSGDLLDVLGQDSKFGVVHFRKLSGIDLWSLDDLDLSDLDVLDWVNVGNFLGDFLLDDFRSEELQHVSGVRLGNFSGDDFVDLSSHGFLLRGLGVVGLALLVW